MTDIKGKTIVITGGAKGIGLAAATEFAHAGCGKLVLVDLDIDALLLASHDLSPYTNVTIAHNNICDPDQMKGLAYDLNALGGVDVLINNAGVGHSGEIAETSMDTWRHLINVNLLGSLNVFYAFLPYFIARKAGHVVNVASGQTFFQLPTWGPYAATKAALAIFSQVSRYELAKHNIKVTTVYPFMVNTGFYKDVKAESKGAKLSMKLIPYYSNSPETVGHKIFKAVKRSKSIEMVNPINFIGKYLHFVPYLHSIVSKITFKALGK